MESAAPSSPPPEPRPAAGAPALAPGEPLAGELLGVAGHGIPAGVADLGREGVAAEEVLPGGAIGLFEPGILSMVPVAAGAGGRRIDGLARHRWNGPGVPARTTAGEGGGRGRCRLDGLQRRQAALFFGGRCRRCRPAQHVRGRLGSGAREGWQPSALAGTGADGEQILHRTLDLLRSGQGRKLHVRPLQVGYPLADQIFFRIRLSLPPRFGLRLLQKDLGARQSPKPPGTMPPPTARAESASGRSRMRA